MTTPLPALQSQAAALAEKLLDGCMGRHDTALMIITLMRAAIMRDKNKTARKYGDG